MAGADGGEEGEGEGETIVACTTVTFGDKEEEEEEEEMVNGGCDNDDDELLVTLLETLARI